MNKDVIIIDDSPTIGIRLSEFLKKSGYHNVKIAQNGKSGIALFKEFIKNEKQPIVFLDHKLPDTNAKSIMTQILEIKPDTRIIIETASNKNEDDVKDVIRFGAYMYIQKPIHFEELKEIITVLEEEESILNESSSSQESEEDGYKLIDRQFNLYKRASISRLSEQSKLSEDDVSTYVKKLESAGNVVALSNLSEICCNSCGSLDLSQIFQCPSCKNLKLKQGKLINHIDCGNSSLEEEYKDNKCPKCQKDLKALGVDYHKNDNYYVCVDCGDKFPRIEIKHLCLKCNNIITAENRRWKQSMEYKLVVRN